MLSERLLSARVIGDQVLIRENPANRGPETSAEDLVNGREAKNTTNVKKTTYKKRGCHFLAKVVY